MNVSCMEYKYARASYGIIGKRVEPTWWPTRIASPHIAHYVSLVLLSIWFGFHLHAEQTLLCLLIYGSRRFFCLFLSFFYPSHWLYVYRQLMHPSTQHPVAGEVRNVAYFPFDSNSKVVNGDHRIVPQTLTNREYIYARLIFCFWMSI